MQESDEEQDELAREILADIDQELRWKGAFDASRETLSTLADQARKEYREGRTGRLDPDAL